MFLFNKKKKLTMICVAMFVLCITVTHAVETIAELQIKPDTKQFEMKFNPQILQGSAYRDTPCHVTSVYGKQGVMKSTLLRAISLFFNMEYGDFKSNNLSVATTTSIDISDVSHDNHLLIDTVGNDDTSFALSRGLDPLSVDLAFSKLVTPVSNVMIYALNRKICQGDLNNLALFSDHSKSHLGEMQKQMGSKPTLIIALRATSLYCVVGNEIQECEPAQYLRGSMPAEHPAWSLFGRIELVRVPDLKGDDWEKIQPNNFRPKEVPQYWEAIEMIGSIINEDKHADLSAYWTGGQLGDIFKLLLPEINDNIAVDLPSARQSLFTSSAQAEAQQRAKSLDSLMQAFVDEPFRKTEYYEGLLAKTREEEETAVLQKYSTHAHETKLYSAIRKVITDVFAKKESDINEKVKSRKQGIQNHMKSVFESAHGQLMVAEKALPNVLEGDPAQVDTELVKSLQDIIQQYRTSMKGWIPPEEAAQDNIDKLTNMTQSIWSKAHEMNRNKHTIEQKTLKSKALPPVEFAYMNHHETYSYEHTDVRENLGNKYPKFFSDEALRNTLSINVKLDAGDKGKHTSQKGCAGSLTLHGDNKEYQSCVHNDNSKKWHANGIYYNPISKVLRAYTEGGGYKGGKKTNKNWMNGVKFTVTTNALATAPQYFTLPYSQGKQPVF